MSLMFSKMLREAARLLHWKEYAHEYADIRYAVPDELQRSGGVYVLRTGFNRAKMSYDVGPKSIECYSFHFVLEGALQLSDKDRGREYAINAGDLFCLFPGVTYRYRRADRTPLALAWIAFSGNQAPHIVDALGIAPDAPVVRGRGAGALLPLLRDIHDGGSGHPFGQQQRLYRLFELLSPERPADAANSPRAWLEQSEAYMRLHYAEDIRVDALAEQAGVHRSRFSLAFARSYGLSPKRYLTKLRMEKAAALLRDTPAAVQDVALTVGYPDLFAFTRAFTNYYGASPTAYRKRDDRL